MVQNILETLKKPNRAFLKFITIRVVLESFLVKLTTFLNFSNENESKRFSKNHTRDFLKKSSYVPIYSLNILGRGFGMIQIESSFFRYTDVKFCFLLTPVFIELKQISK